MYFKYSNIDFLLKEASKNVNKEVSKLLKDMSRLQDIIWKGTAYSRAAENIENLDKPITEFEDFTEIPGVGHDIDEEIREYLETGKIQKLENLRKREEEQGKFSREQALQSSNDFFSLVDDIGLTYEITGSIRRKVEKVKDIDVIILTEEFKKWEDLVNNVSDSIQRKGTQEIDFIFNGIGINLRAVPKPEFSAGVLYFTGPKSFEVYLRQEAKKKGYKLNRHGLFDKQGNHIAKTERDVFDVLEIPYVIPEER